MLGCMRWNGAEGAQGCTSALPRACCQPLQTHRGWRPENAAFWSRWSVQRAPGPCPSCAGQLLFRAPRAAGVPPSSLILFRVSHSNKSCKSPSGCLGRGLGRLNPLLSSAMGWLGNKCQGQERNNISALFLMSWMGTGPLCSLCQAIYSQGLGIHPTKKGLLGLGRGRVLPKDKAQLFPDGSMTRATLGYPGRQGSPP
jgi:hypothetical protein